MSKHTREAMRQCLAELELDLALINKDYAELLADVADLRAELKRVEAERDRLATAIRNQCANLCTEAWASRGKHHPDCLAYELDVANTAERCDYSEDQIADGMSAMDDHVGDREE